LKFRFSDELRALTHGVKQHDGRKNDTNNVKTMDATTQCYEKDRSLPKCTLYIA